MIKNDITIFPFNICPYWPGYIHALNLHQISILNIFTMFDWVGVGPFVLVCVEIGRRLESFILNLDAHILLINL